MTSRWSHRHKGQHWALLANTIAVIFSASLAQASTNWSQSPARATHTHTEFGKKEHIYLIHTRLLGSVRTNTHILHCLWCFLFGTHCRKIYVILTLNPTRNRSVLGVKIYHFSLRDISKTRIYVSKKQKRAGRLNSWHKDKKPTVKQIYGRGRKSKNLGKLCLHRYKEPNYQHNPLNPNVATHAHTYTHTHTHWWST